MLALCALGAHAAEPLKNWFDDPFFQVSSAIEGCPTPLGPLMTEAERRVQAHSRAERGTTCWLAGQCDRPNDFAYSADIAEGVRAMVAANAKRFERTSLWVTVQGRVVFIEGCVPDARAGPAIEALAMKVPHVKQAIASVRVGRSGQVPYKPMPR
ncbi:BON domain-containing protein [Piscinibacter gummiphilus]|uniref:BON domain-containing protein n=1 Tax=Piscinibacter gummiphilus TaxID=946333 RepID=A0ABZ0CUL3_9BURK|nr:BON domain-containing protein [Piscinibacter gummiphilus]WOB08660.1 BON domain-containing protein [Piscinibacter gummiphilus]